MSRVQIVSYWCANLELFREYFVLFEDALHLKAIWFEHLKYTLTIKWKAFFQSFIKPYYKQNFYMIWQGLV